MRTRIHLYCTAALLISFLLQAQALSQLLPKERTLTEESAVSCVLITGSMWKQDLSKQNAAILITEKKDIDMLKSLFAGNRDFQHACGYHYDIDFIDSSGRTIMCIPFNKECERFMRYNEVIQRVVLEYGKKLEKNPSHFIYDLHIPATVPPDSVVRNSRQNNLPVFLLNGIMGHHTSLTFTYMQVSEIQELEDRSKWDAEQEANRDLAVGKMKQIIGSIQTVATILHQSEISFPMEGFGGGTIEHQAEVTLKFANSTDLTSVKAIIAAHGGTIEAEDHPASHNVQYVDVSDKADSVLQHVKKYLPYVLGIEEH